ncbi:hypothetical protein ACTGW0_11655, partial [Streptococcus suis]
PERLFSVLYPILIDFDFQLFTHEFGLLFHLLVDKLTIISRSLILFKKQKLTYNRFMKLTIEQTKELKTYLKDKTYSPFHRRLQ